MSPVSGLARFFDGAKKDMEAKGLKMAKDLIGAAAVTTVAEVVATDVVVEATPEVTE
jgi:hypothetical protein